MLWLAKIFRSFFLLIDTIIYWAIELVYQLFIMISETGVFTPESIREFGARIYVLLGVFMLFKVSFSLITYILNPDDMMDKSKGMGKLLTNFFVVLIGIVAVPYVFQAAYSLQSIILKENVIGSIIMGQNAEIAQNSDGQSESDYIKQGGDMMSFTTLSAFIRLNPAVVGEECSNKPVDLRKGSSERIINPACTQYNVALQTEADNGQTVENVLIDAYSNNDTNYYISAGLVNLRAQNMNGEEDWLFEYTFIISSIAGGLMAWILLLFCIDIATRSVKLGFLQLIAPIPIISYIDPKSGKDGVFKKWLNECVKTYFDLFIRLIAIYFALYVITIIVNGRIYNITTGETQNNIFVIILIIFGALMFAKQLPDLISNITGVKFSGGGFTLNPMKKLGQSPYAAGAMGLVGGALGGGIANAWAAHKNGLGFKKGLASTLAGVGSAGFRGAKAGFTSGGKGSLFDGAAKGIRTSSQARNLRAKGYGIGDKMRDKATDLAGVKFSTGTTSELKNRTNLLQQQLANSRRNEQAMSTALNQRISESGNMTAGLLKTFDGAMQIGSDGKPEYVKKTYEAYLETVAQMHASSSGVDWSTLDDSARASIKTNVVTIGKAATEVDFNSFNELYEARNNEDLAGRKLEKEINDIQDDMGKFKDRNKQ